MVAGARFLNYLRASLGARLIDGNRDDPSRDVMLETRPVAIASVPLAVFATATVEIVSRRFRILLFISFWIKLRAEVKAIARR